MKKLLLENKLSFLLILLGLIGPVGYFCNVKILRGLGTAWMISPLPIVFSEVNNYEAFSSQFTLVLKFVDGAVETMPITPTEGRLIKGPYNRRNIYGAVLGYAPIIKRETVDSVLNYSFCTNSKLKEEFNIQKPVASVELIIVDQTKTRLDQKYIYGVVCGT